MKLTGFITVLFMHSMSYLWTISTTVEGCQSDDADGDGDKGHGYEDGHCPVGCDDGLPCRELLLCELRVLQFVEYGASKSG